MSNKMKIIYKENKEFPQSLSKIRKCPKQLYAIGNVELLKSNIIAIVGTRHASEYGLKMAKIFSEYLSKKGITIISGMAVRN